jgi:hypothetical protein
MNLLSALPLGWRTRTKAGARDGGVSPAGASTQPSREAREAGGQVASWLQAARSVAGQRHRPTSFEPLVAFDPYGDGQALPKPPRRQLNKQILAKFDTAALDVIQEEADGFPYQGSIQARNALFLDTELRTGSVMVGFLLTAKVTTLMGGVVDLNKDSGPYPGSPMGCSSPTSGQLGPTTNP